MAGSVDEEPIHFTADPFQAVCGADHPNQRTTEIIEHVTCLDCLASEAFDAAAYERQEGEPWPPDVLKS